MRESQSIKVYNFKSLDNFELPLAKFNCLVGLNGSGKSTVLQFFDFLSQQFRGDLSGWLKQRQWEASDLNSKLTRNQNISFEVILVHHDNFEIKWATSFNRKTLRCTIEHVDWDNKRILRVIRNDYHVYDFQKEPSSFDYHENGKLLTHRSHLSLSGEIPFEYQGSVMSQIKESQLPKELLELKKFFTELHALDLLVLSGLNRVII